MICSAENVARLHAIINITFCLRILVYSRYLVCLILGPETPHNTNTPSAFGRDPTQIKPQWMSFGTLGDILDGPTYTNQRSTEGQQTIFPENKSEMTSLT